MFVKRITRRVSIGNHSIKKNRDYYQAQLGRLRPRLQLLECLADRDLALRVCVVVMGVASRVNVFFC